VCAEASTVSRAVAADSSVKVKVTLLLTVSQSVCLDVEPLLVLLTICLLLLTITDVSLWDALSDERSGLSFVSQSLQYLVVCQYIHSLSFFFPPWSESASELYRLSDRRVSAK
jgi:hypothetical protein